VRHLQEVADADGPFRQRLIEHVGVGRQPFGEPGVDRPPRAVRGIDHLVGRPRGGEEGDGRPALSLLVEQAESEERTVVPPPPVLAEQHPPHVDPRGGADAVEEAAAACAPAVTPAFAPSVFGGRADGEPLGRPHQPAGEEERGLRLYAFERREGDLS
jgi:hypothetical protein